jgi:hypothetical protein
MNRDPALTYRHYCPPVCGVIKCGSDAAGESEVYRYCCESLKYGNFPVAAVSAEYHAPERENPRVQVHCDGSFCEKCLAVTVYSENEFLAYVVFSSDSETCSFFQ